MADNTQAQGNKPEAKRAGAEVHKSPITVRPTGELKVDAEGRKVRVTPSPAGVITEYVK